MQHAQRAANDSSSQQVNPVLAAIPQRIQRVPRFHYPCLLPAQPFHLVYIISNALTLQRTGENRVNLPSKRIIGCAPREG
jgi:hypothetical protein